jgi:formamidopyrimidine-DNA glycosylase
LPELPEVETVVRGLAPEIKGLTAGEAWVDWSKVIEPWTLSEFDARVQGQTIQDIHRRGKYICITLDHDYLVVHLRMTGRLYVTPFRKGGDPWVHFSLALQEAGYLAFSDARKFGRVYLTSSLAFLEEKLGPEPLELEPEAFKNILRGSRRSVKAFLLDQKQLAGVGNIYADEALFQARIHPEHPVDELTNRKRMKLGRTVQAALHAGIHHEGASINWYRKPDGSEGESQEHFAVYGKKNEPCIRCGTLIRRIVVAQRGTHFCPRCQKL